MRRFRTWCSFTPQKGFQMGIICFLAICWYNGVDDYNSYILNNARRQSTLLKLWKWLCWLKIYQISIGWHQWKWQDKLLSPLLMLIYLVTLLYLQRCLVSTAAGGMQFHIKFVGFYTSSHSLQKEMLTEKSQWYQAAQPRRSVSYCTEQSSSSEEIWELRNSKERIEKPCRRFRFWCIYQLTECSRGLWKVCGGSSSFAKKLGRDCLWLIHWHRNWVPGRRGRVKKAQWRKLGKGKSRAVRIDGTCPEKGPADIYIYTHIYTQIYTHTYICMCVHTYAKEAVTKPASRHSCCTRLILLYWFLR